MAEPVTNKLPPILTSPVTVTPVKTPEAADVRPIGVPSMAPPLISTLLMLTFPVPDVVNEIS